ncbi:MAG: AraC family transcriptional regulator [Alphaproteobacteria bacterium]|nr:AraC family transcriptional regulator [Alphaproteobacteria bacterium]
MKTIHPGLNLLEAGFSGHAYDKHRHNCYAIGHTISGVQSFGYRGEHLNSLAGSCIIIHPDEVHDGHAGTEVGFHYRMAYVDPLLIQKALPNSSTSLPFIKEAVHFNPSLLRALALVLDDRDMPLENLRIDTFLAALTDALLDKAGPSGNKRCLIDKTAIFRAREFLDTSFLQNIGSEELEKVTGLDRFSLARQFRALLGTSPYNHLVSLRLEAARSHIMQGVSLVSAAIEAGFSDQSHLTRHFKRVYGLTPGAWQQIAMRPHPLA